MYRAKLLLELLTKHIPPGEGQKHNLTLNEGGLEVTLMLGEKYIPFWLQETDFDLPVRDLVLAIKGQLRKLEETGPVEIP